MLLQKNHGTMHFCSPKAQKECILPLVEALAVAQRESVSALQDASLLHIDTRPLLACRSPRFLRPDSPLFAWRLFLRNENSFGPRQ